MRMTNKIMQNNSLYNINLTKVTEDKLNTQMSTQSKIARPSDDPVVAIRALRLRSSVTTVTQYYEKNAPDADQWLTVTADALSTITGVVTDLYKQAEKAADEELTASDLNVILDQIRELTGEVYSTGNQDYAGRYIFTGYRTDTELTIKENQTKPMTIKETLGFDSLYADGYTNFSQLNTTTGVENAVEQDITSGTVHRIRLSYDDIDSSYTSMDGTTTETDITLVLKDANGDPIVDGSGNPITITVSPTTDSAEDVYNKAISTSGIGSPVYIPSTGEVILTEDQYNMLSDYMRDGATLDATYGKSNWDVGDLNPVHYFECRDNDKKIQYNEDGDVQTKITYDVGYNQQIQVNTNASEVFFHDFQRDVDDLSSSMQRLTTLEELKRDVKQKRDALNSEDPQYSAYQTQLDAINKAYSYVREEVQQLFERQMTNYQNYMDGVNLAITQNGTRSARLELIGERLASQQSTFKELQEENEGIDMTVVAVQLSSAKLTYDAALQATAKIMQNSLMNYI